MLRLAAQDDVGVSNYVRIPRLEEPRGAGRLEKDGFCVELGIVFALAS